MLHTLNRCKGR